MALCSQIPPKTHKIDAVLELAAWLIPGFQKCDVAACTDVTRVNGTFVRAALQPGEPPSGFHVGCLSILQHLVAAGNGFFVCFIKSFIQSFEEPWRHLSECSSRWKMKVKAANRQRVPKACEFGGFKTPRRYFS